MGLYSSLTLDDCLAPRTCTVLARCSTIRLMDPAVAALKRLLGDSTERRQQVADVIGFNEQTLYQVANGIKLKSGKVRGVGRKMREALDAHYPGWRDPSAPGPATPVPQLKLATALPLVIDAIAALPAARWVSVRAQLDQLAQRPEMRDDVMAELQALLGDASSKQPAAAA